MRLLSLTAILAGTATLSAVVALAEDRDKAAIHEVITQQLRAFEAENIARAFSYAAPAIKSLFGNPERFARMVREGYPMVWRPGEVTFLSLSERDGQQVQRVMIRDRDGAVYLLDYAMVQSFAGWQINGVALVRDQGNA